ncbi:MAG: hypothetical protein JWM80_4293 [Cyanobacteria bacterium RYN_339]|nr:hypothetical protein [Cyanobacteria bacterium RYN_339]
MRRPFGAIAALICLLAACKAGPGVVPRVVRSEKPAIAASASAKPSTGPVAAAVKLVQPGRTTALDGIVQIDASYIVAQGGGNIVAQGGGNIVAQGGGNIISTNGGGIVAQGGGNIISTNGGGIVAQGGGNIISGNGSALVATGGDTIVAQGGGNILVGGNIVAQGGGNIVAQGGGNIVAQGGGNIVAQGGGNIVAQGGGNIVAQGGGNYRLAQAAELAVSKAQPAFGTTLPTVGTVISVRSMVTGAPVAIGNDDQGRPVYRIYSNLAGQFKLFIPQELKGLVVIEARVPKREDARSIYEIVSGMGDIDEDTAVVAKYLRRSFSNKFRSILELLKENRGSANDPFEHPDRLVTFFRGEDRGCKDVGSGEAGLEALIVGPLQELLQAIKDNPKVTPNDYPELARRLGDVIIGNAQNLDDYRILPTTYNAFARELAADDNPFLAMGADAKVLKTLQGILVNVRTEMNAVGQKLGDGPALTAYFAKKPYLVYANAYYRKLHPTEPSPHYEIKRASDLADFLVEEYFPLVSHSRYGCVSGECPSPAPLADPCGTSAAALPTPAFSVVPCDIYQGCLPAQGIGSIGNDEIHALSYNVLHDLNASLAELGLTTVKPMKATDVHVLYAASASFGINLVPVVAQKRCELLSIIARYPQPGEPCEEP